MHTSVYDAYICSADSVNEPEEEPYLSLDEVGETLEQLQRNIAGKKCCHWLTESPFFICKPLLMPAGHRVGKVCEKHE